MSAMNTAAGRNWLASTAGILVRLGGGLIFARVVSVSALLIFSAFSGPEPFAAFGAYIAAAMVLYVIVGGRYEEAIVFALDDAEAATLSRLAALIGTVIVCIAAIVVAALAAWQVPLPADLERATGFLFFPLAIALRAASALAFNHATRQGSFAAIARGAQAHALTQGTVQLSLLALGVEPFTCLAAGDAAGYAAGTLVTTSSLDRSRVLAGAWSWPPIAEAARRWQQMPAWNMPTALLSVVALNLPVMLLAVAFPANVAGQIAFAMRLLDMPSNILTGAVSPMLRHRLKEAREPIAMLRASFLLLLLIGAGFAGAALVGAFLAEVFSLFSGTRWALVPGAVACLALYYAGLTVSGPLVSLVVGFRAERQAALPHAAFLIAIAGASALMMQGVDWRLALSALAAAMIMRALLFVGFLWRMIRMAPHAYMPPVAATPAAFPGK